MALQDLLNASRKSALNYGYGSASSHIASATFNTEANLADNAIAYNSQPQVITDLLGGHVDYAFGDISVVTSMMQAKKLKGLAVTSPQRLAEFPDIPTIEELGYHLNLIVWVGLAAPQGTSQDIVKLINKEIGQILRDQRVREKFQKLGMIVSPNSAQEHGVFVKEQKGIWTERVRAAHIQQR